jgi:hypothetical protein
MRFSFTIKAAYNFYSRNNAHSESSLIKIPNIFFSDPVLGKNTLKIIKKDANSC